MMCSGVWPTLKEVLDEGEPLRSILAKAKGMAMQNGKKLFVVSSDVDQREIEDRIRPMVKGSFAFAVVGDVRLSPELSRWGSVRFASSLDRRPMQTDMRMVDHMMKWASTPLSPGPFR